MGCRRCNCNWSNKRHCMDTVNVSVHCVAQLTSWSRVLLEKLTAAEVLKENSPHFVEPEHSLPLRPRSFGKLSPSSFQLITETF
jgi:hypothetical protein